MPPAARGFTPITPLCCRGFEMKTCCRECKVKNKAAIQNRIIRLKTQVTKLEFQRNGIRTTLNEVPLMLLSDKQRNTKVDKLKARIDKLNDKIEPLKQKIEMLYARVGM